MKNKKNIFINTISKFIARFGAMLVNFFMTPYLLGVLGSTAMGLVVLTEQFLPYCLLAGNAVSNGTNRFATLAYYQCNFEKMNKYLSIGLSVSLVLIIPSILLVVLAAVFPDKLFSLDHEYITVARYVILIMGLGTILNFIMGSWHVAYFMTEKLYIKDLSLLFCTVISAIIIICLFNFYEASIIIVAAANIGSIIIITLFYIVPKSYKLMPQMRFKLDLRLDSEARNMASFSGLAFLGTIGYLMYYSIDSFVISNLSELGVEHVYVYNLGQRWDPTIRFFVIAFALALTPRFTSLVAEGRMTELRDSYIKCLRYTQFLGLLPCILLASYSYPFLSLWINPEIANESSPVLKMIMLNFALGVTSILSYQVCYSLGKIKEYTFFAILGGIANVALGIILVKVYDLGLIGIALSTVITFGALQAVLTPFIIIRHLKITYRKYFIGGMLRPILILVPLSILTWGLQYHFPVQSWFELIIQLAICCLFYLPVLLFLGFDRNERKELKVLARKGLSSFNKTPDV